MSTFLVCVNGRELRVLKWSDLNIMDEDMYIYNV